MTSMQDQPERHVDTASDDQQQAPVGYRTNEEWQTLLAQSAALIRALDDIEDDDVRRNVFATLQTVDAVHREALHRLVRLFKEGVLDQVVTDPAIHTLMGMYDLLPEEAPACQKVWDFLGDAEQPNETAPALAAMPDDPPHWSPAPIDRPPKDGPALICRMEEGAVILLGAGGQHFALEAACIHHGDVISRGRLDGFSWICPGGPGCVYDIRNGRRMGGGSLVCLPVKSDETWRFLIGFGVPFEPKNACFLR
ncbi:MAG: Rieske (2Fe-2S) protein [Geminicoccaceae bacterium]